MLAVRPVGVTDTFFDFGGYSLLAAGLLQRVREELGVDLPARLLYQHPTVADLARCIVAEHVADSSTPPTAAAHRPVGS